MTKAQILALDDEDHQLDELVHSCIKGGPKGAYQVGLGHYVEETPPYSSDVELAWDVLEEATEEYTIESKPDVYLVRIGEYEATAGTLPVAMCRAALLATLKPRA